LQLDAHGPVDAQPLDLAQVRPEVDDAAARRQVAVPLAVAVADVGVDRLALESPQFLRLRPRQLQMRYVDVGPDGGVVDVVDEADGDAGDADDGQAGPVALALDEAALLDVDVERVGEDVDGVEADLLGHADAVGGFAAGLGPGGVDQSELHGRRLRGAAGDA